MEENAISFADYLSIVWRRKLLILISFVVMLSIVVVVVLSLPRIYKSTGTILVESQQIPQEFIQSAVGGFADERIQIIKQRIMTSKQIFELINKFDLYQDAIKSASRSDILDDMRERISINGVSVEQRQTSALIAFTVSFEHQSPIIAQKIANELCTLFLNENIKSRTVRAAETMGFLQKESDRLRSQIEIIELQVASYKQANKGSLPENLTINLKRSEDIRTLLFNTERELNAFAEKKKLMTIQLEAVGSGATNQLGSAENPATQQLRALRNQYVSLSARYGTEHPDVKAAKRNLKAFEAEYGQINDNKEVITQIEEVKSEIYELSKKYSSEHPDLKPLKRKLASLEEIRKETNINPRQVDTRLSSEYIQTQARLESTDSSIDRLNKSRVKLESQLQLLDAQINKTPEVERGLSALERDRENTKEKYQEMRSKLLQAELAMSLETEQKGERFTLLEPPLEPSRPIKPDRFKFLMLGIMLSLAGGLGMAGLAEVLDGGIYGALALAAITKTRPLVVIPYITTQMDEARRRRNVRIIIFALVFLICIFVLLVHFFYKPLDLLWFILLRKLNLS